MRAAKSYRVRFFHPLRWLQTLRLLARRGHASEPVTPARRRLLILQIDGLSSRRLREALVRGDLPNLQRWLDSGEAKLRSLVSASAPSTAVFTAGLLYGACGGVPGFGWYDRDLGREVRMDVARDVAALEGSLVPCAGPLLDGGTSYGTIWPAGAADAFFNVVLFARGAARARPRLRNAWDFVLSALCSLLIAGRVTSRFVLELAVGLWDFQRWVRHIGTTRFEWRFLYMRLFVAVVMRDVSTQCAIIDVLRGVPRIFADYLGYDEYAHRRGPDAELALYNLRGIDKAIGRIRRAIAAVPEYHYDLYVLSDHGQTATTPFVRVMGEELQEFVSEHAPGAAASDIEVVSGGSIAHVYFNGGVPYDVQRGVTVDAIERRHPGLLIALATCPAIGLIVGRGRDGPVLFYRGRGYRLADRHALEALEPVRCLGYELCAAHLRNAAEGLRHGDLVLYGAFAPAGEIAFDFEFGSHGGIGPDELDLFVVHPAGVELPFGEAVAAEDFYRFFAERYGRPCVAEDAPADAA
jgi:hypothetical protein